MVDNTDINENECLEDNIDKSVSVESEYGKYFVEIQFDYSKSDNVFLPNFGTENRAKFIYKAKSIEDEKQIERRSYVISQSPDRIDNNYVCPFLHKRLTVRRCLYSIDDWVLKRNNDWIINEDWDKVKVVSAPLINMSLMLFDILTSLKEEEEKTIEKQAVGLYASNSGGVANPHPILASYCSLASLWDKLGVNSDIMKDVLSKDYLGYRIITGAESDAMRRASRKND